MSRSLCRSPRLSAKSSTMACTPLDAVGALMQRTIKEEHFNHESRHRAKAWLIWKPRAYQQGSTERDFMENAGRGIALAAHDFINRHLLAPLSSGSYAEKAIMEGMPLSPAAICSSWAIRSPPSNSTALDQCSPLCQTKWRAFFLRKKGRLDPSDQSNFGHFRHHPRWAFWNRIQRDGARSLCLAD